MKTKEEVYNFIIKVSKNENLMCDYYEIRDNFKIADEYLSKAIKELKNENKIVAKDGEYLPKG